MAAQPRLYYDDPSQTYVGFWKVKSERYENIMPWEKDWQNTPVENSAAENQENIIKLLIDKEKLVDSGMTGKVEICMGASKCRLCGANNGNLEYYLDGFVWPQGYLHYLKDHNVDCDLAFKQYLITSSSILN